VATAGKSVASFWQELNIAAATKMAAHSEEIGSKSFIVEMI